MERQRIKKVFFYGFVGLLPFQAVYLLREVFIRGEKWQYGTVGVYFSDMFLFGAIVFAILATRFWISNRGFSLKSEIIHYKKELWLALFLFWAGLSVLWAPDQVLAGYFFVKLLLAAGVFFLARSLNEKEREIAVGLLIMGAVLQGALGTWQFLAQSTFSSTWLGMSVHEVWKAGTSVLKLEDGRWLRAYGTLPHPNMLGGFLSAAFVMGAGWLTLFGINALRTVLMSRDVLQKSGASLRERFTDTVRMAGTVGAGTLIFLGLVLTFSRTAWLGAAIGISALAIYTHLQNIRQEQRSRFRITFLKMGRVLVLAGAVFVSILHNQIFPRFDTVTIEQEGSASERLLSLQDAKRIILKHSLIGVGAGNFTAAVMVMEPDRPVWSVQPAHNVFVLIFSELGLVGCVLLGLCIFSIMRRVIPSAVEESSHEEGIDSSTRRLARNDTNMVFAIALAALLPSLFLDHWLWTSHFGLLFFFLIAGLAARKY